MISNPVIRVCAYPDGQAAALSARLGAGLAMLAEARRIALVGPDEPADIAHAVGAAEVTGRATSRLRSVDVIPLRSGRLAASPGWVRRERRTHPGATWLAHGHSAGRLLLAAGLAPAGRVHCLPLLCPPVEEPEPSRAAVRAAVRERLGLRPGQRLVIGHELAATGGQESGREPGWERDLRSYGRHEIVVVRIRPVDREQSQYRVRTDGTGWLPEPLSLTALLAGGDGFVAADPHLAACSPAVAALDWGLPVVARATDAVSDPVLTRGVGAVVPAGAGRIARGVLELLDGDLLCSRAAPGPLPGHRLAEFAHSLLSVYRSVQRRTLISGAA